MNEFEHITPMIERLQRTFPTEGLHWSCLGRNGENILRYLITKAFPFRRDLKIIEIGTHQGVSSSIWSEYGEVHTFDIQDYPLRKQIHEAFNIKNVTCYVLNDSKQIYAKIKDLMPFDIAFVDGNHSYDSVKNDFNAVKECGTVIFHDYEHEKHTGRTVKVVDELKDGIIYKVIPFAMWQKHDFNMG